MEDQEGGALDWSTDAQGIDIYWDQQIAGLLQNMSLVVACSDLQTETLDQWRIIM